MDPRDLKNGNVIIEDVDSDDDVAANRTAGPADLSPEQRNVQDRYESIVLLKSLGDEDLRSGAHQKAIRNYELSLEEDPDCPHQLTWRILMNKGRAHAKLGQHAEAIKCFECSLLFNGGNVNAHEQIGTSLFVQRRFPDALRHFQSMVERFPSRAREWTQSIAKCMQAIKTNDADAVAPIVESMAISKQPPAPAYVPKPYLSSRAREAVATAAPALAARCPVQPSMALSNNARRQIAAIDTRNGGYDVFTDAATRVWQWLRSHGLKTFAEIGEYVARNGIDLGVHKVGAFCKMYPALFRVVSGHTRKGAPTTFVEAIY